MHATHLAEQGILDRATQPPVETRAAVVEYIRELASGIPSKDAETVAAQFHAEHGSWRVLDFDADRFADALAAWDWMPGHR